MERTLSPLVCFGTKYQEKLNQIREAEKSTYFDGDRTNIKIPKQDQLHDRLTLLGFTDKSLQDVTYFYWEKSENLEADVNNFVAAIMFLVMDCRDKQVIPMDEQDVPRVQEWLFKLIDVLVDDENFAARCKELLHTKAIRYLVHLDSEP
jgi:hypothetical protein